MQAENYIERITLQAKFDASEDQHTTIFLYTNPQFVVSILIIPFTLSMISETAFTIWNRSRIEPSYISLVFFILGLITMLVIFGIIFITHVNSL